MHADLLLLPQVLHQLLILELLQPHCCGRTRRLLPKLLVSVNLLLVRLLALLFARRGLRATHAELARVVGTSMAGRGRGERSWGQGAGRRA